MLQRWKERRKLTKEISYHEKMIRKCEMLMLDDVDYQDDYMPQINYHRERIKDTRKMLYLLKEDSK